MLSYETAGRVSRSAARAILDDLAAIDRAWWNGRLALDADPEGPPATVSGRTALFNVKGAGTEDDLFMAFADAAFILGRLAAWARQHKLKWAIRMHDEEWGAVDPGGFTAPLRDQMKKWARRAKVPAAGRDAWAVPETRRAELLARYKFPAP